MFSLGLTSSGTGFDPLIILLTALLIEAGIGDARLLFRFISHPNVVIAKGARFFEHRLNRDKRSQMDRAIRGLIASILMILASGSIGWAISWFAHNIIWGWALELLVVVSLISCRGIYDQVKRVREAIDDTVDAGRQEITEISRKEPWAMDGYAVARTAIETAAIKFNSGLVGPAFWYLLFGLPGLLVYRTISIMDDEVGYKSPRFRAYGLSAARLDDIANLAPARLSAIFITAAALFVPTANAAKALKTILRDSGKPASLNTGWPICAMAGTLSLALLGPEQVDGNTTNKPWVGDGSAKVTPTDLSKALYLFSIASLINGMAIAAIAVIHFSW